MHIRLTHIEKVQKENLHGLLYFSYLKILILYINQFLQLDL